MAATSGKQLAVGMRRAVIFALDANGYPAAIGVTAYEGIEVVGPKAFTLTVPDARRIVHTGNDRVLALDYLPPTEPYSVVLRVPSNDMWRLSESLPDPPTVQRSRSIQPHLTF